MAAGTLGTVVKRKARAFEKSGLDLAAEAVHLVRTAPPAALGAYYVGTAPFVVAFLHFWSDMSRSAFAERRCLGASLVLAGLFVWMKCWQAIFAARLREVMSGRKRAPWTPRRLAALVAAQLTLQPLGLLSIPIALLLMLPFYAVYAFYQNVTALADGNGAPLPDIRRKAWTLALVRPKQNHILIWLLCPWVLIVGMLTVFGMSRLIVSLTPEIGNMAGVAWFLIAVWMMFQFVLPLAPVGAVVAGNIAIGIFMIPALLEALLGVQTRFTLSGWNAVFNTTFLATVFSLTYLCLDPLAKAAYCLRLFYTEARQSGDDLKAELAELTGDSVAPSREGAS